MYWWRIGELRAELAAGTLGQRAQFVYLLLYVALATIAAEVSLYVGGGNRWDQLSSALAVALTVLGTTWLYRLNGAGRGRGFLERYLALGWVFALRFGAASIPIFIGAYAVGWRAGVVADDTGPFDVVVGTAWLALYWIGLARQLTQVVAAEAHATVTP